MVNYDYIYIIDNNIFKPTVYRIKFLDLFVKFISEKKYDGTTRSTQTFKSRCNYEKLQVSPEGGIGEYLYMSTPETGSATIKTTQSGTTFNVRITIKTIIIPIRITISYASASISNSVNINFTVNDSLNGTYYFFIISQNSILNEFDSITLTAKTLPISGKILPNTDATLKSLNISAGTLSPKFSASKTSYKVSVSSKINRFTVTPTMNKYASIKVNNISVTSGKKSQNITLQTGNNIISIVVTAQDGKTKKTYRLTINKKKSIIIPKFNLNKKLLLINRL